MRPIPTWLLPIVAVWSAACGAESHWYSLCPGDDTVGDGKDQDCDGADGVDADHDGHASIESGGDDCDDLQADVNPGVQELAGGALAAPVTIIEEAETLTSDALRHGDGSIEVMAARWNEVSLARFDGAEWSAASVQTDGIAFSSVISGRIGPDSSLHYAYGCAAGLCYASNQTGSLVEEIVDEDTATPWPVMLHLDPSAEPAIVTMLRTVDQTGYDVVVLRRRGGGWTKTVVANAVESSPLLLSTCDSAGHFHLLYRAPDDALAYTTDASGSWQTSTLPVVAPWVLSSMAVDEEGAVHLGLYSNGLSVYRTNRSGSWRDLPILEDLEQGRVLLGPGGEAYVLARSKGTREWALLLPQIGGWSVRPLRGLDVSIAWIFLDRGPEVIGLVGSAPECGGVCWPDQGFVYAAPLPFDENCDGIAE